MVYRVFVEKKKELAFEAKALLSDARTLLGITNLTDVRLLNRYDAENITEELFEAVLDSVDTGKILEDLLEGVLKK